MAERTCTEPGCDKKFRARGLCATHYNQQHQPNRHTVVTVACDQCGAMCEKPKTGKFARRFCSLSCRDAWRLANPYRVPPRRCPVPESHPVRVLMEAHARQVREVALERARQRRATAAALREPRPCVDCSIVFEPVSKVQVYCSLRCSKRVHRRARRAAENDARGTFTWSEFMTIAQRFDFRCAYCGVKPEGQLDPDHVVPLSRGGANTVGNLLPACRLCNCDKWVHLLSEWNADRERRGKPPRITSWEASDRRYWHLTDADTAVQTVAA